MESTDAAEVIFEGKSGVECESFIRIVRKHGFTAGRPRDNEYLADFAAACMEGGALRWFESLDPKIQADWSLLRQALLDKYPSERHEDSAGGGEPVPTPSHLIPAPAAAPPMPARPAPAAAMHAETMFAAPAAPPALPPRSQTDYPVRTSSAGSGTIPSPAAAPQMASPPPPMASPPMVSPGAFSPPYGPRTGRIRVLANGVDGVKDGYVRKSTNWFGCYKFTKTQGDALIVRFTPTGGRHNLELMNCSTPHQFLGISWDAKDRQLWLGPGSDLRAELASVDTALNSSSPVSGPTHSTVWQFAPDGNIITSWTASDGITYTLEPMLFRSFSWLYLVADFNTYSIQPSNTNIYTRVRFVFEQIT